MSLVINLDFRDRPTPRDLLIKRFCIKDIFQDKSKEVSVLKLINPDPPFETYSFSTTTRNLALLRRQYGSIRYIEIPFISKKEGNPYSLYLADDELEGKTKDEEFRRLRNPNDRGVRLQDLKRDLIKSRGKPKDNGNDPNYGTKEPYRGSKLILPRSTYFEYRKSLGEFQDNAIDAEEILNMVEKEHDKNFKVNGDGVLKVREEESELIIMIRQSQITSITFKPI